MIVFAKFTMLSLFFLPPEVGAKLHCQLRWEAMVGFAPLDPSLFMFNQLRWFPLSSRIEFKIPVLVFMSKLGVAPK